MEPVRIRQGGCWYTTGGAPRQGRCWVYQHKGTDTSCRVMYTMATEEDRQLAWTSGEWTQAAP